MKIGIATYFWDDNPGLFFQALATYDELRHQFPGAQIEVINAMHWDHGWRPSFRPGMCISSVVKRIKYIKARRLLPLSQPNLLTVSRKKIADYINAQNYDLIVVGADVSLKPLPSLLGNELPYHWIDTSVKAKKVMLASSADITRIDQLSDEQITKMKEVLADFSFIGIRDTMTHDLMVSLGYGNKACRVPDPAFPYQVKRINNPQLEKIKQGSSKKLCGISLAPNPFTIDLVNELQKEYTIVCNMFPWKGKTSLKYLGPFEWSNIFRCLDVTVTASFHESIFSFKAGIPAFAVDYNKKRIDVEHNQSKTLSLMKDMGLPNHHVSPYFERDAKKCCQQIVNAVDAFEPNRILGQVEYFSREYKEAVSRSIREIA